MFHVSERFSLRHFRHSPRQQHHSDLLHLTAHGESLRQFQCCFRCKRIPVVRSINSNLRNTMIFFEENFLEFSNLFPFSLHHIFFIFRIYVQRYKKKSNSVIWLVFIPPFGRIPFCRL